MIVNEFDFGRTSSGDKVSGIRISNGVDCEFSVINRGATLLSVLLPNKDGVLEECTLGFDNIADYEKNNSYFGATIGRVGNRIANSSFNIGDTTYELTTNANGCNSLHGGLIGFDKVMWSYKTFNNSNSAGVIFKYKSSDGEEGFPGNLDVEVIYSLTNNRELIIEYKAITDKITPVNLTNHAYWNLTGNKSSINGHLLQIEADSYLPVNDVSIPTGDLKSVKSTIFDFRALTNIGSRLKESGGFDHNFNLSLKKQPDAINRAYIEEPISGRFMEILTTEPGIQLYTTENSICLEAQMYPDAINRNNFQSILLSPGEIYNQKTVHRFGCNGK